ncbi:MAG: carboxymuconolactone decarboxylase family protein [Bacteroidaceae bacterium]|nr:carboxymuconolactone decarboxylase family protein [Bacteroidaceae bacterium]MBR6893824.1 carboxymuconolactone decarboxylase family protein [Bacteroidaceae bacterium]
MKEVKITKRAHDEIRRSFSSRAQINSLRTDPELTEIVDNFAFDKTLQKSEGFVLEKTRVMCILAATIGCNAINEFKLFVDACLNFGVKPREIREIVYMAYPYVGAALLVDYTLLMNDIFENNGIRLPLDPQNTVENDEEAFKRGLELMDETFGPGAGENMIASAPKGQEHIGKFMAEYCFGYFYSRNGIDTQHRELICFCLIAAMGGCDDRLLVHARGCRNHKITKDEMIAVATVILPWIGFPRTLNAVNIINKAYSTEQVM